MRDFDTLIARSDMGMSARLARRCRQDLPLEELRVGTFLLLQSCGTPITALSALNRLSRRVSEGSGSTIWIFISFTLRLRFSPETIRIRGIRPPMFFTTEA